MPKQKLAAAFLLGLFPLFIGCSRTNTPTDEDFRPTEAASRISIMKPDQPITGHEYKVLGPVGLRGPSICESREAFASAALAQYPQVDAIVDYRKFDNGCDGIAVEFVKIAK